MSEITTAFIDSDGLECVISEMANDPSSSASGVVIQIDQDKLAKIKARDENPQFVTIAIESGWSRSKRHWRPSILKSIAEQVNKKKPVGYKGHMKPDQVATDFPEPQTVWLGATTVTQGDKTTLWVKGYNLPSASVRGLLDHEAVNSVSVFGNSKMKPVKGGYEVIEFDLESIDWSRKNQSGMSAKVMAITSEMESEGGKSVEPKDITALSEDELRTHAPLLVAEIERKAKSPFEEEIGEMTTVVAELQPEVDMLAKVRELLGLAEGENPVEKVTNLLSQIEDASASEIKAYIKEAIAKKVKTERGQALVARLVGEMHTEYDGEDFNDELKSKIDADLTKKIEEDEILKTVIGEMAPFNEDDKGRGSGQGGSALGGKVSRTGQGTGTQEDGVVKQNAHITVRKRTLA
jgi:hypothetical protein